MARDAQIEVIMTVGHRKGWEYRCQGDDDQVKARCRDSDSEDLTTSPFTLLISCAISRAGFRGFLVYDEGVLFLLNKMRDDRA